MFISCLSRSKKGKTGLNSHSKSIFTDYIAFFGRPKLEKNYVFSFLIFSQVGLAVGDIESVQKYAFLRNKGKFIDFVVGVERNLPKFVTRRLHKPELVVTGRYVDRKISSG